MARIRDTARRLWVLYIALTALQVAVLLSFGWFGVDERMHPFNAVAHALTTMPTGGFSPENRGIEVFAPATQWLIIVFMLIAGTNFALTYRALIRHDAAVFRRDEEFRLYLGFIVLGAGAIGIALLLDGVATGENAIRQAVFQTVSMMTTTGYASTDFVTWPALAVTALIGLMFIGGSAGSTSGSVKVARHLLLGRILSREIDLTVHPELISSVRMNRAGVSERTLRGVSTFVLLYIGIFITGTLVIATDGAATGLDLTVVGAFSAAATTLGNVGPAFGFAGPMGSFEPFGDASTATMIGLMWLGRLELIPVLVLFSRHYWRT